MDPHDVLGVPPGAGPEEIARAYRDLAKRFHPDRRPDDVSAALMMREVNAAYTALQGHGPPPPHQGRRRPDPPEGGRERKGPAGSWLEPRIRRALGDELLAALEPREPVTVVTDAATSDAFHVRLVVTDRRFVWLRDDAPTDRVRSLRFHRIDRLDGSLRGRRRTTGRLEIEPRDGRRIVFAELEPSALRAVLLAARRAVPAR